MDDLQGYKNLIALNKMKQDKLNMTNSNRKNNHHYNSCLQYLSITLHYIDNSIIYYKNHSFVRLIIILI